MDRKILLNQVLGKGDLLTVKNQWYREYLKNKIIPLISEDFEKGDITTELLIENVSNQLNYSVSKGGWIYRKPHKFHLKTYVGDYDFTASAVIIAKQNGIVAGLEEAGFLYNEFGINVISSINDGKIVKANECILKIKGNVKALLKTERSILDLISRMSGIATMTYDIRNLIKDKIKIASTRKTLLPYLDKKAVFIGGGLTHRLGLWDGILIKDNHLALQKKPFGKNFFVEAEKKNQFIEIEVKNQQEALVVFSAFKRYKDDHEGKSNLILIIMFDNMNPSNIRDIIKKLKPTNDVSNQPKGGLIYRKPHNLRVYEEVPEAKAYEQFNLETYVGDYILFEASGNITEKNIKGYVNTGVDCVSIGILTHSVKGFDLTQKLKWQEKKVL